MYMKEMIAEQKEAIGNSEKSRGNSLLTNLVSSVKDDENKGDKGSFLSDEELYGNMFIFILAGHETTAGTLTFALILLAAYPEVQGKLLKHVHSVLGDNLPTYEDFPKLTYVLNVMKETLRLYPAITIIPKITSKPTTLDIPLQKYRSSATKPVTVQIPANTHVSIDVSATHRNPKFWARPNEFLPERFDPKSGIQDAVFSRASRSETEEGEREEGVKDQLTHHRQAWVPFSDGARSCIGRKFSEIEFVCVLSTIIQRYSIHLPPGVKVDDALLCTTKVTLSPKNPPNLVFRLRESTSAL